ncbi:MAG: O-antigen ligase family protein [Ruminiclostridium sp.]|nr:O-antigen ligase family protein [Ruminiclostridium sp.]
MAEKIKKILPFEPNAACLFMAAALSVVGLFNEYLACGASFLFCVYLFITSHKSGTLIFRLNLTSAAVLAITAFYFLSILWAVDSGMAFTGFLKILPLPLFMLIVMQDKEKSLSCFSAIPTVSVIMTIVSGIVMIFSPRNEFFAPAGRLSGFLQYSNTFALVLLVSIIIIISKEKHSAVDYFYLPVLIGGIILSGSRTVFILTIIAVPVLVFISRSKKLKILLGSITAVSVAVAVIYVLVTGNFDSIGRFLSVSLTESTFVGRLLYYHDALPLVLKNPFGTGYLGFYYLQQSIQTGLYSVRYVHNDFLQLALDIGWIPTLMLIAAVIRAFFKKDIPAWRRLMIFIMSAHCFFDIDLQFTAVFMIYVIALGVDDGKEIRIKSPLPIVKTALAVLCTTSLYMLVPLAAAFTDNLTLSYTLYPWNTDVNTVLMVNEENPSEMDKSADRIIEQNEYITVAYSAKAAYAYSQGNFTDMIKYKELAIENAPLIGEEYEDYISMLLIGEELYLQAGDTASAEFCRKKIDAVINKFNSIEGRLSKLGKMIDDRPKTEFSQELTIYLKERGFI